MTNKNYSRTYDIKWAEVDPNGHIRHTVYGDYAVDVRYRYLNEHGLSLIRLHEIGIGPVLLRDEAHYLKEVVMGETITVDIKLAGASPDGGRWIFQHEVRKQNGKMAAVLRVEGGWLDLAARRLVAPPPEFASILKDLERTEDFSELSPYNLK
jgi:acyl-CoA thioester hydrolase